MDSKALKQAWEEHPHSKYRGCAPDPDVPGRAAGDPSLSLDAWHGEDRDGSEPQRERLAREQAAVEVCLNCPVMVACAAYANSVVTEGGKAHMAEPDGIWGGELALERHRAFIRRRHEVAVPAPARQMRTPQRLRVLEALAVHADAQAVADAADVDLRTANWQRSRLVTQLNLDKETATRAQLLRAAVDRGLLDAAVVVVDDGSVPAVPPPAPKSSGVEAVVPTQLELWSGALPLPTPAPVPRPRPVRVRVQRPRSARVVAPVVPLFPNHVLEAAA